MSVCSGLSVEQQRGHWERKRSRAIRELVLSEQQYSAQLHLLVTYFLEILKAKGTLKENIRESIFSSVKDIHSVNQSLLVHLENGSFTKGLSLFCSHLQLYSTYVDNIYTSLRVLAIQLKKNMAFRRFKRLQESRPEMRGLSLEDLLQLPVQRVEQYERFLQEVAANTSPQSPEFQLLTEVVSAVSVVFQKVLKNRRHHENQEELCRVQSLLKGRRSRVIREGRWFLKEGFLQVVPSKGAETKLRMFFLFSDMLLQTKRCNSLHPTHAGKFSGEHAFPLQHCELDKVFGHTRSQGGLLSLTFPRAKLLLMSNNKESLNDWYQSLSSAIRELQSKPTVILQCSSNRKRNVVSNHRAAAEQDCSAPKRPKPRNDLHRSAADESNSCVII